MASSLAMVISDMGSGGAQRVVAVLANAWVASGRQVTIVTLATAEADFYTLDPRVRRIGLGRSGRASGLASQISANLGRIRHLRQALRGCAADVVISFIAPTNVLTVLACLGLRCRVVISERNDPARQSFGRVWDSLRGLSYWLADRVTANSRGVVEQLSRRVAATKVFFVPNPVAAPATPDAQAQGREPVILAVGRLHRQKGYDILLQAFANFRRDHPGWTLRILGTGPLEATLRSQAERLGLTSYIDWRGAVSNPFPHYRAAEIFVLASRHEGMPNALLEAMSCGLASVVTTASPGPLELIEDGVSGLTVPAEDPERLTVALDKLATSPDLRQRLGVAARLRVQANSMENVLKDWELAIDFGSMRR
jgi:GalNAc-alpha-(1->4)-GalNAc-alpha-(1->3)-diNAcBac-PP-undecaprenol alpha-1,4-N-acetyl-D-galactosaminyltransferase